MEETTETTVHSGADPLLHLKTPLRCSTGYCPHHSVHSAAELPRDELDHYTLVFDDNIKVPVDCNSRHVLSGFPHGTLFQRNIVVNERDKYILIPLELCHDIFSSQIRHSLAQLKSEVPLLHRNFLTRTTRLKSPIDLIPTSFHLKRHVVRH